MKTRKRTANQIMHQKPCGCNDFEYCERHVPVQHTPTPKEIKEMLYWIRAYVPMVDRPKSFDDSLPLIVHAINAHEELLGLLAEGVQRVKDISNANGIEDLKAWAQDAQEAITKAEGKL